MFIGSCVLSWNFDLRVLDLMVLFRFVSWLVRLVRFCLPAVGRLVYVCLDWGRLMTLTISLLGCYLRVIM